MNESGAGPFPVDLIGLSFEAEENSAARNDARTNADSLSLSTTHSDGITQSAARAGRFDSPSDVDWYRIIARGPFSSDERLIVRLDTASDARWFDRHEVVIQTSSGHLMRQARSGSDLALELQARDTVVDALSQRAEFYVKVSPVAGADHAHRSDPYRLLVERRSVLDEPDAADSMALPPPIRVVGKTAIVAAHRADVAYVVSPDAPNEWLLGGLSGDALSGTLARLRGVKTLQFLDQTVDITLPGTEPSSEPTSTSSASTSSASTSSASTSSASTSSASTSSTSTSSNTASTSNEAAAKAAPTESGDHSDALIMAPEGWRHHAPSGLGDGFDQAGTALTRIVVDAELGSLDMSAAAGVRQAQADLNITPADARLGTSSGLADFRASPEFSHIDGTGSTVVIIDSGIDLDHPAFNQDRLLFSYDFSGRDDPDASDFTGHGTHVAGIIASADAHFPGVAPGARLIILKALGDDGSGEGYDVREAIAWTLANRDRYDINVVNLSLGFGEFYTESAAGFLSSPLRALAQSGVIIVAAAGNQYVSRLQAERQGVAYPAADASVIGVGASWSSPTELDTVMPAGKDASNHASGGVSQPGSADAIALFSQRDGGDPALSDIFAPGVNILSADTQGGFTQVLSGTSMAAAQISGVAALAQSLALERLGRRLSPGEFMQLLEQTADLIQDQEVTARDGSAVDNTGLSFPRVNVQALAQAIVQLSETLLSPATSLSPLVATSSGETVARVGISASETTQSRPDASMDAISAAADYANLRGVDDWIIGTPQAERLWGDSGDDRLQGAGGHDSMAGGSGDDWLQPALTGSHWLDGGPGHDVVSYANPRSFYRISSVGRLTLVRNHQGDEDLLLDIEQLQFADQAIATTAFHTERTTDLTELGADSSELGADWPEPGIDSLGPRLRELAALADAQPERPGVIALAAFHAEAFELMAAGAANDPAQPLLDPARVFMTRTYQEQGESVVDVRLAPGMRPILEGRFMASFNPAQAELDEGAVTAPSGWIVQAVNRVDDQGKTLGEVVITVRRDPSSPPPAMGAEPQTVFSLPFTPQWEGLRLGRIDDVRVDVGTFTDAAGFNYAPAFGANRLAQLVSADLPVSGLAGVSGSVSVLGMARQDTPLQIHEDLVDTTDNTPLSGRGLRIQWFELRSGIPTPIPGATETVFIPSQTLVGSALGVRLQFGSGNAAQVAYSPFTEPVANHNDAPLGALQLSGAARLGERLSVLNTVTDADGIPESGPDAPRVLWFADGNPIQGAGGDSLLLTQAFLGRRIHARLLYTDRFGAVEQLDSDQTSAVAALAMVDPEVSRTVPSLSGVPGDGNGDGIPDIQQITVISAPVSLLGPVNSRAFVTLVGDSIAGKPADNTGTQITALAQDIGNVSAKPVAMDTPLGHIQFTVELDSPGNTVPFSLYVQGVQINGYWKQDASGTWVNLASPPFGGLTTSEGSKIRLDFKIRDGDWPFDADGQVNGVITDPGVPALMAQSVALHLPAPVSGGLWF